MSFFVAGLGNPGPDYASTRHNIGYMVVEELAKRNNATLALHKKTRTRLATVRLAGKPGVIGVPTSFMNVSGGPVSSLLKYQSLKPEQLIVIHDELDLDFGVLRLKLGGGTGGHNGLKDITKAVNTPDFFRVRVGIGRPPGQQPPASYVLKPFSGSEKKQLADIISQASDAVEDLLALGLEAAQQKYHSLR